MSREREREREQKNYLAMRNFRMHKRPNELLTLIGFPQAFLTKTWRVRTNMCGVRGTTFQWISDDGNHPSYWRIKYFLPLFFIWLINFLSVLVTYTSPNDWTKCQKFAISISEWNNCGTFRIHTNIHKFDCSTNQKKTIHWQ